MTDPFPDVFTYRLILLLMQSCLSLQVPYQRASLYLLCYYRNTMFILDILKIYDMSLEYLLKKKLCGFNNVFMPLF